MMLPQLFHVTVPLSPPGERPQLSIGVCIFESYNLILLYTASLELMLRKKAPMRKNLQA